MKFSALFPLLLRDGAVAKYFSPFVFTREKGTFLWEDRRGRRRGELPSPSGMISMSDLNNSCTAEVRGKSRESTVWILEK